MGLLQPPQPLHEFEIVMHDSMSAAKTAGKTCKSSTTRAVGASEHLLFILSTLAILCSTVVFQSICSCSKPQLYLLSPNI